MRCLEAAAVNADNQVGFCVPRHFLIEVHGAGFRGQVMDAESAAAALYISEDLFYRIIDLAVTKVDKDSSTIFTRVSGHKPGAFEDTWNRPSGDGPFKQMIAHNIVVTS